MRMRSDGRWGKWILTRDLITIHCHTLIHFWSVINKFRNLAQITFWTDSFNLEKRKQDIVAILFSILYVFIVWHVHLFVPINFVVLKINTDVIYVSWTVKPPYPSHTYSPFKWKNGNCKSGSITWSGCLLTVFWTFHFDDFEISIGTGATFMLFSSFTEIECHTPIIINFQLVVYFT